MACNAPTPTLSPATSLVHPGLLENAPDAWLQLLLACLAREDKLALFKVSRQTARRVIHHCPNLRLVLTGERASCALTTAEQAITLLLKGVEQLTIQVHLQDDPQPFPYELSPYIHKLILQGPARPAAEPAVETSWLQFNRLTGLKELCVKGAVSECVVISLCIALEAGHMPHLHHFEYDNCTRSWALQRSEAIHRRLASALGASVTMLHVAAPNHDGLLLNHLHLFLKLEVVQLTEWCWISERVMKQLCEHPSLLTVILSSCMHCENCSNLKCKSWTTLVTNDEVQKLHILLSFPLEALQEVVLQRSCLCFSDENAEVLTQLLKLGSKLVWTPVWPSPAQAVVMLIPAVKPLELCTTVMPFLRCLRSPGQHETGLYFFCSNNTQALDIFPTLWQHTPACVCTVDVDVAAIYDGHRVWDGMPVHVTNVALHEPHCASDALRKLITTVPAHVRSLKLTYQHAQNLPIDHAGLQALAPPHVQLSVCIP